MSMQIIAVSLAVIAVELALMIAVFVVALLKVRSAAAAVEVAAYRVDQEVLSIGDSLRSGVGQTIKGALGLAFRLFRR